MDSRERVRKAFSHQEPDRVPIFEQAIDSKVASEILGRKVFTGGTGLWKEEAEASLKGENAYKEFVERMLEDTIELYRYLEMDMFIIPWHGYRPSKKIDDNTYFSGRENGEWEIKRYNPETTMMETIDSSIRKYGLSAIEKLVKDMEENSKMEKHSPTEFSEIEYVIARVGKEKYIAEGVGIGIPMETAWLEALILRPDLVERYLDIQLERILRKIKLLVERGVDCIWGGGDLATNKGPIYSPLHFRKFILPRLKQVTKLCDELGVPYVYRTDGNIWPIAEELLVESGVHGYGEIDIEAGMNIGELKRRFPHLTLWGGVKCGSTLVRGTKEEIITETKKAIEEGAPGGGFIFGSSNAIQSSVPPENFLLMLETAKKYGKYKSEV